MRWFETPNFNFIKVHKIAYVISGLLIAASIIGIVTKGLQYGIDFNGGKEFVLEFSKPVEVTQIRNELAQPLGSAPVVKKFGSDRDILVRTDNPGDISTVQETIVSSVRQLYPKIETNVVKTDIVGPRFAEDLKDASFNAIIFALIAIFLYILVRFKDWTFSAGAVAALFHDVMIVLGIFTIFSNILPFNLQIDEAIVAAFLTIVGYSINDTVVVFDRIRENSLLFKTMDEDEMINKSLNDTLSRTVITSLTTLFTVTVLFIFGGEVLKGFSFALMLGIIVGTYSSIFIASPLAMDLRRNRQKQNA